MACCAAGIGLAIVAVGWTKGNARNHMSAGSCQVCHREVPAAGAAFEQAGLRAGISAVCEQCHRMPARASHPVGVRPQAPVALQRYLDEQGRVTCVTCHDVHQDDQELMAGKEKGLLRGHVQGAAFCAACHEGRLPGTGRRHELAGSYAHLAGALVQREQGTLLDQRSTECLSCHDGVIAKAGRVDIRSGEYRHGLGPSHPVGVDYPTGAFTAGYADRATLPQAILLFDGKVGCLSCHNLYSGERGLLVMDNTGSALCVACHRK